MKKILFLMVATLSLTSCATIFGGGSYNAHIQVVNEPDANIIYNGATIGRGIAFVKVKRKDANKFSFAVQQDDNEKQQFNFHSRTFRGGAFVGSLVGWTGWIYIPLPWGVAVDGINGAWWKPNVNEPGIVKQDYKNYKYLVNYKYASKEAKNKSATTDVIYLKNGNIFQGIIIEQIPNKSIKLKTKDGNVLVFKIDEIEKIEKK